MVRATMEGICMNLKESINYLKERTSASEMRFCFAVAAARARSGCKCLPTFLTQTLSKPILIRTPLLSVPLRLPPGVPDYGTIIPALHRFII